MKGLVTIAVPTYNSGDFVLETLESIYNQSYSEIELIISDDHSTDNTLNLVRNWLSDEKKKRFSHTKVVTVNKNTGVSANCNRCIKAANSQWIKFIAGDDILLPDCIEDNMAFVAKNANANIIFSQVKVFKENFAKSSYMETTPMNYPYNLMDKSLSAQDQFELLLISDRIHYTPSFFFNKKAIEAVGNYDEKNRLVEDYPMWLKLTGSGEKLYYFHKPTVGYRMHDKALNNQSAKTLFKPSSLRNYDIRKVLVHPHLPWEIAARENFTYVVENMIVKLKQNHDTPARRFLYRLLIFYLNPFYLIYGLKKKFGLHNKSSKFYY